MKTLQHEHIEFEHAIRFAAKYRIQIEINDEFPYIQNSVNVCLNMRHELANRYLNSVKTESNEIETIEIFKRINTNIVDILGLKPNYNESI